MLTFAGPPVMDQALAACQRCGNNSSIWPKAPAGEFSHPSLNAQQLRSLKRFRALYKSTSAAARSAVGAIAARCFSPGNS